MVLPAIFTEGPRPRMITCLVGAEGVPIGVGEGEARGRTMKPAMTASSPAPTLARVEMFARTLAPVADANPETLLKLKIWHCRVHARGGARGFIDPIELVVDGAKKRSVRGERDACDGTILRHA